jgi:hypothetical protein
MRAIFFEHNLAPSAIDLPSSSGEADPTLAHLFIDLLQKAAKETKILTWFRMQTPNETKSRRAKA